MDRILVIIFRLVFASWAVNLLTPVDMHWTRRLAAAVMLTLVSSVK